MKLQHQPGHFAVGPRQSDEAHSTAPSKVGFQPGNATDNPLTVNDQMVLHEAFLRLVVGIHVTDQEVACRRIIGGLVVS